MAARRFSTAALCTRVDWRRAWIGALQSAIAAVSPLFSASRSSASSRHFCRAKANQLFTSASSRVSTFRSIGLCSREQEEATHSSRLPTISLTCAYFSLRSARQTLRPLISPAESSQSAGRRLCSSATSSWPWTRSTCRPCTGSAVMVSRLSVMPSK